MQKLELLSNSKKLDFANSFLATLGQRPFGALSKSELDASIYEALRLANYVRNDGQVFDMAEQLQITPSRVNSLRYNSRLRAADRSERQAELAEAICVVVAETGGDVIVLNVEDRYWRDSLIADLKTSGIYVDFSFNRERLVLRDPEAFDAIIALFGAESEEFRAAIKRARRIANAKTAADLVKQAAQASLKAGAKAGLVSLRIVFMQQLGI